MKRIMGLIKNRIQNKVSDKRGITMAEVLIVIAIIGVLSGVAFISVQAYQRSMAQLERDAEAKELFVAAQNHLSMAKGVGYLGATDYGTQEEGSTDIYYYIVNKGDAFTGNNSSFLDLMLPFGSIDETVRLGGNYIIRYQKSEGLILDVFYCSAGSDRFDHNFIKEDYVTACGLKGEDKKDARKNIESWNNAVLGWYGAEEAESLPTVQINAPDIEVINSETLKVNVTDKNSGSALIRLLLKGELSGLEHYVDIDLSNPVVMLDDITVAGTHFCEFIYGDPKQDGVEDKDYFFIPGENITIQAMAYRNDAKSNIEYSKKVTTNSLFGDGSTSEKAIISNFRHLENLDKYISSLDEYDSADESKLNISKAVQATDLDWKSDDEGYWFNNEIRNGDTSKASTRNSLNSLASGYGVGNYVPVSPDYELSYDGKNYSISNVTADYTENNNTAGFGDAGLFGTALTIKEIKNLELMDFSVSGADSAGALAGILSGTDVENVIAINSDRNDKADIPTVVSTEGSAGGLIGTISGGSVKYCAAALVVKGDDYAGGLIGNIADSANPAETTEISSSYSGGHTKNAAYNTITDSDDNIIYNVTATSASGIAGGLIGNAGKGDIRYSYSTCSVSGTTAGGFIGKADTGTTGAHVSNSYCTGLVSDDSKDNAFIGDGRAAVSPASGEQSYFYEIINEVELKDENDKVTGIKYKEAVPGLAEGDPSPVEAIDASAYSYETFVGAEREKASAYDTDLVSYYNGKYSLKTIEQLEGSPFSGDHAKYFVKVHYGDWPAPEIFVINET